MPPGQIRYKIAAKSAPDFSDEFFVECPKCHGCARLIPMGELPDPEQSSNEQSTRSVIEQGPELTLNPKHLECFDCRFRRSWNPGKPSYFRSLVNWFGELSLFMQVDCGDQTIWALNPAHLEYLEEQLRLSDEEQAETTSPMDEWLEHNSHAEIAACLASLKHQPANA